MDELKNGNVIVCSCNIKKTGDHIRVHPINLDVKVVRNMTVQEVYPIDPRRYSVTVRMVPAGTTVYWYECEIERTTWANNIPPTI
jgi:hypothetical protein